MVNQRTPFQLDEGIWLENKEQMIRWDSKISDLQRFLSPEIIEHNDSIHLTWSNQTCLGGLKCDVSATRFFGIPNPRAYHLYLESLHCIFLDWIGIAEWSVEDITIAFKDTYEHLRKYLGEATFSYPEYAYTQYARREGSLPAIFWEFPLLTIGYSASFPPHHKHKDGINSKIYGARFSISIIREPSGYDELKAQAQAIRQREGEGARVNYVAW
jgi:hypothetical protein